MYWIAGLLIGFGLITLVSINWDSTPSSVKVAGDFAIWVGIIYSLY